MAARYIGVDLGIRTPHRAVVYDGAERRGKPFAVPFSREGWDDLVRRATDEAVGPVNFVVEPTGLSWLVLAAQLTQLGHQVIQVPPLKSSQFRKFLRRHAKTDVIDSAALARAPQVDPEGVLPLTIPTPEQMILRWLVRRRDRFSRQAAAQKLRVHALLTAVNPALMGALGEEKFGVAARAFLRNFADPEKVVALGEDKLYRFWKRHSKGHVDHARVSKVFAACVTTAAAYSSLRAQEALPFDYKEAQIALRDELDEMEHAERQAERLHLRIGVAYSGLDPARTLEGIPGFGTVIAPVVEAFIGDVRRFRCAHRLTSFCGFAPRKKQSGLSDRPMPITKAGDRLLKKSFFLAAEVARRVDPQLAAYYARRFKQGDHHDRIIIAIARKLVLRVFAVLMRREAARTAQSEGRPAPPVSYELRSPDGTSVTKKEARELIRTNFARSVVAPERDARDRRRCGKKAAAPTSAAEGPSIDAPGGIAEPSATPVVAQPSSPSQLDAGEREASPPALRRSGWSTPQDILAALAQRREPRGGKPGE